MPGPCFLSATDIRNNRKSYLPLIFTIAETKCRNDYCFVNQIPDVKTGMWL